MDKAIIIILVILLVAGGTVGILFATGVIGGDSTDEPGEVPGGNVTDDIHGDETPNDICNGSHTWQVESRVPATCYSQGSSTYICEVCSEKKTDVLAMTNHSRNNIKAVAATCTTDGVTAGFICRNEGCGYQEGGEVIPAFGHSPVNSPASLPTCVAMGFSGNMVIEGVASFDELCGEYVIDFVTPGAYVITITETQVHFNKTAEELEEGEELVVIKREGTLDVIDNVSLGSEDHSGAYTYVIENGAMSVFTADGNAASIKFAVSGGNVTVDIDGCGQHCTTCLEVVAEPTITYESLGHDYVEAGYIAPTCAAAGSNGGTRCSRCPQIGEKPTEEFPKLTEHSAELVVVSRADCTNDGYSECPVCGAREVSEKKNAEKHLWVLSAAATAPSCADKDDGTTESRKCSICETTIGGDSVSWETLHEDGHENCIVEWEETIAATETSAGEKFGSCPNCDYTARVDIPRIEGGDFNEDNNIYPDDIVGTPPAKDETDEDEAA